MDYLAYTKFWVDKGMYLIGDHSDERMLERDITIEEIEETLTSDKRILIEIQSPDEDHCDERVLIYAKTENNKELIVCITCGNPPLFICTVERPDYTSKWINTGNTLIRKKRV